MASRLELLSRNTKFQVALGTVLFIIFTGLIGSLVTRDPSAFNPSALNESPSWEHKLGTTHLGCDVLAQITKGIVNSLLVGSLAGLLSLGIGLILGGVAAYNGGMVDEGLNATMNTFMTLPMIPLLILLAGLFEQRSLWIVALMLSVKGWTGIARPIRSQVLSLKERNFVDLARVSGKSDVTIIFKEIFPNMYSYIFVTFVNTIGGAIMAETGISLIGLGPTNVTTLGSMLHWSMMQGALQAGRWWWFVPPGIVVVLLVGTMIMMVSVVDEVLNPRLRGVV